MSGETACGLPIKHYEPCEVASEAVEHTFNEMILMLWGRKSSTHVLCTAQHVPVYLDVSVIATLWQALAEGSGMTDEFQGRCGLCGSCMGPFHEAAAKPR